MEAGRTGRCGEHGPRRGVRRPAHAADRAGRRPDLRDRPGGLGPDRGQGVRRVGSGWPAARTPVRSASAWFGATGRTTARRSTVPQVAEAYAKTPLEFTAGKTTDDGRLEITAAGQGRFSVGTVSLMPADNVQGMRADTLALLKELDSPVYRWPGGNFVSGYNWQDGIGDPDRRPPRKNPAWQGIEHNDMGLDEFMVFCRVLKTEPYIAVNSGLGEVQAAVDEVAVRQRQPRHAAWASCGRKTATASRTASSSGASATRCTAAGNSATCRWRSTWRSTTCSPRRCARRTPRSS